MYKDIEKRKFHVFTDGKDHWTKTEKRCAELIKHWKKEGHRNFRVWTVYWEQEEGIYEDENCILSIGSFPY